MIVGQIMDPERPKTLLTGCSTPMFELGGNIKNTGRSVTSPIIPVATIFGRRHFITMHTRTLQFCV